jgi:hypothetical protein
VNGADDLILDLVTHRGQENLHAPIHPGTIPVASTTGPSRA